MDTADLTLATRGCHAGASPAPGHAPSTAVTANIDGRMTEPPTGTRRCQAMPSCGLERCAKAIRVPPGRACTSAHIHIHQPVRCRTPWHPTAPRSQTQSRKRHGTGRDPARTPPTHVFTRRAHATRGGFARASGALAAVSAGTPQPSTPGAGARPPVRRSPPRAAPPQGRLALRTARLPLSLVAPPLRAASPSRAGRTRSGRRAGGARGAGAARAQRCIPPDWSRLRL